MTRASPVVKFFRSFSTSNIHGKINTTFVNSSPKKIQKYNKNKKIGKRKCITYLITYVVVWRERKATSTGGGGK